MIRLYRYVSCIIHSSYIGLHDKLEMGHNEKDMERESDSENAAAGQKS